MINNLLTGLVSAGFMELPSQAESGIRILIPKDSVIDSFPLSMTDPEGYSRKHNAFMRRVKRAIKKQRNDYKARTLNPTINV